MSDVQALEREITWLQTVVDASIRLHFGSECPVGSVDEIAAPSPDLASALGKLIGAHALTFDERIVLALALAPHLRPALLDAFMLRNPHTDRRFTEFGGSGTAPDFSFRPTLETAAFVVTRGDLARRLALTRMLTKDHVFQREAILDLDALAPGSGLLDMPLRATPATIASLMGQGEPDDLPGGGAIAARRIETDLDWHDIVLSPSTREDLDEILAWLAHPDMLRREAHLARHFKPGYRALFHGPPGTGKTLAAALLGKVAGIPVYRVDLSMITSKWVGETEKNLGAIFHFAERRRCILFFDEADSIFGKRSSSSAGQNRYSNLEVSYLLQRIEDFTGLVVLATNIKGNIDEAFVRRFQSMIHFSHPDAAARLILWRSLFPDPQRAPAIDFERLAADHDLSGSTIANVARHAVLKAHRDGSNGVGLDHLHEGIRREYRKAGKTLADHRR